MILPMHSCNIHILFSYSELKFGNITKSQKSFILEIWGISFKEGENGEILEKISLSTYPKYCLNIKYGMATTIQTNLKSFFIPSEPSEGATCSLHIDSAWKTFHFKKYFHGSWYLSIEMLGATIDQSVSYPWRGIIDLWAWRITSTMLKMTY